MILITWLTWLWIAIGIATFTILIGTKVRAPYGRHARKGWGPTISNKAGWIIMELPALLIFPVLAFAGPYCFNWLTHVLVALWIIHYFNRTLIFPLRTRTSGKRMPVLIVASAITFNTVNGLLNGLYNSYVIHPTPTLSMHHYVGLGLFITGMVINWHTDSKLISLRKNANGYLIPEGGLFKYISCPNHFGEIVEWTGFAILAWNLPTLSFAVWTFCNLVPRALNHHAWYKEQFPEYPKSRKAVIPFLL